MGDTNKATWAIAALREAADAYDQIPQACRRTTIFGDYVNPQVLRDEADHLEQILSSFSTLIEDPEPKP